MTVDAAMESSATADDGRRSVASAVQEVDVANELQQIEDRFGIAAATFDDYVIFRPNSKWLAIADRDLQLPQRPELSGLGMPFLYPKMRYPRMTTSAIIRFGHLASRNVIDLDDDVIRPFVHLETLPLRIDVHPLITGPGHLIARYRGMILGLANCRAGDPDWTLLAMLPKTWRDML